MADVLIVTQTPFSKPMVYPSLHSALHAVWEYRLTGLVIISTAEIIEVRRGKRKSADGKKWLPSDNAAVGTTGEKGKEE